MIAYAKPNGLSTLNVMVQSGGGVMGYIPVQLYAQIEQQLGIPLWRWYNLMGGSSVGAINTALLATGKITAKDLLEIYPKMVGKVFERRRGFGLTPKYDRANFYKAWADIVGLDFKFGDCKTKLMITAVNVTDPRERFHNTFFKSWHDHDAAERLVDVVVRSFAAPLYFGQLNEPDEKAVWYDGGTGSVNLPATKLMIEARDVLGWDDGNMQIFFEMFGCGYDDTPIPYEKGAKQGWIRQLLNFFSLSEGGMARTQARIDQIENVKTVALSRPNIAARYWDVKVPEEIDKLDGVKFLAKYGEVGRNITQPLFDIPFGDNK